MEDVERIAPIPEQMREHPRHTQMACLHKAQKYIEELGQKKTAVEIKIPSGVILTTCPEKWKEHNKPYLRGNAAKNQREE